VQWIWKAFSLQPHRSKTFKLSTDPLFVDKVCDIIGLYLDPPQRAVVLGVDEVPGGRRWIGPSQSSYCAQGRRSAAPMTTSGMGRPRCSPHSTKAGTIVGKSMARHRAAGFRRFLNMIEKNVTTDLDVHVVMDNALNHKTQVIRNWFARRPRWHAHYTPTSASWINQVERFFALLTDDQIRRGTHRSVRELETAINAYIDVRNADSKPFRWTKSADDILASIQRFCQRTVAVQQKCG
jgi:transposase